MDTQEKRVNVFPRLEEQKSDLKALELELAMVETGVEILREMKASSYSLKNSPVVRYNPTQQEHLRRIHDSSSSVLRHFSNNGRYKAWEGHTAKRAN